MKRPGRPRKNPPPAPAAAAAPEAPVIEDPAAAPVVAETPEPTVYTPPAITGYRKLTQAEIDLINTIKAHGETIADLVHRVEQMGDADRRWIAIGRTDLQTGLMALIRAIARPESF